MGELKVNGPTSESEVDELGINPWTSRMLSERSTTELNARITARAGNQKSFVMKPEW